MQINKEFLLAEIEKMQAQRDHAHDVAVSSQASIDTMKALLARLDLPEEELKFSDLGLPDPIPVENQNGINAI